MKERTTVQVENRPFRIVLMARLCELTRLLQIKGGFFFLVAKMIQRLILLVLLFCDAFFLSDIFYYFSVFMMTK